MNGQRIGQSLTLICMGAQLVLIVLSIVGIEPVNSWPWYKLVAPAIFLFSVITILTIIGIVALIIRKK